MLKSGVSLKKMRIVGQITVAIATKSVDYNYPKVPGRKTSLHGTYKLKTHQASQRVHALEDDALRLTAADCQRHTRNKMASAVRPHTNVEDINNPVPQPSTSIEYLSPLCRDHAASRFRYEVTGTSTQIEAVFWSTSILEVIGSPLTLLAQRPSPRPGTTALLDPTQHEAQLPSANNQALMLF